MVVYKACRLKGEKKVDCVSRCLYSRMGWKRAQCTIIRVEMSREIRFDNEDGLDMIWRKWSRFATSMCF